MDHGLLAGHSFGLVNKSSHSEMNWLRFTFKLPLDIWTLLMWSVLSRCFLSNGLWLNCVRFDVVGKWCNQLLIKVKPLGDPHTMKFLSLHHDTNGINTSIKRQWSSIGDSWQVIEFCCLAFTRRVWSRSTQISSIFIVANLSVINNLPFR